MTQHRNEPGKISNYFDQLLAGIGHRGSSFTDIDSCSHDGKTKRWLIQEFKNENEPLDKAQHWMLRDLATLPKWFTVAVVVKRHDGLLGFARYFVGRDLEFSVISEREYQAWFRDWWNGETYSPVPTVLAPTVPAPAISTAEPRDERMCALCASLIGSSDEWFIDPGSSGVQCGDCYYAAQSVAVPEEVV